MLAAGGDSSTSDVSRRTTPNSLPVSSSDRRSESSTRLPRTASADWSSTTSSFSANCSACASSSIEPAREHLDQLDLGVADDEAPGRADGDCDLQGQANRLAGGGHDPSDLLDHLLHREPARRRARAVVPVEPARDRVAAEVDDVAAVPVELRDHGVEDPVQVGGELLSPALGAELLREGLGQRREAGDVGEERRSVDAVGHRPARGERPPEIAGEVRLGVLEGVLRRRLRRRRRSERTLGHACSLARRAAAAALSRHSARADTRRTNPFALCRTRGAMRAKGRSHPAGPR